MAQKGVLLIVGGSSINCGGIKSVKGHIQLPTSMIAFLLWASKELIGLLLLLIRS
jgi:hypothetical protein